MDHCVRSVEVSCAALYEGDRSSRLCTACRVFPGGASVGYEQPCSNAAWPRSITRRYLSDDSPVDLRSSEFPKTTFSLEARIYSPTTPTDEHQWEGRP